LTLVPEVPAEMDWETVVTPAIPARKVLTFDDLIHLIATYPVEFVNTDENWKKFGIKIFEGYSSSALNFDFWDDNDLESFSSISVEFTWLADENWKKFEIFDEQWVYLVS
jgi:hypothetical protein